MGRPAVRVVGGEAKGRRLVVPGGRGEVGARPTTDLVRGAIFNLLDARVGIVGAQVADVCCGTGALGIEALSRGAAACTFVDVSARAIDAARRNLTGVGLGDRSSCFVRQDALRWAADLGVEEPFDVVLADPPYGWDGWDDLLGHLRGKGVVVVAEAERVLGAPGWDHLRDRRHGGTVVTVLTAGRDPDR